MALQIMEGFSWTTSLTQWATRYNVSSFAGSIITSSPGGRFGGNALQTNSIVDVPVGITSGIMVSGFALYNGNPTSPIAFFNILSGGNSSPSHLQLWLSNPGTPAGSGGLMVKDGGGSILAQTSVGYIQPNTYHYIEISATIDPTNGNFKVFVDGSQVLAFSGNTQHGASPSIGTLEFNGNGNGIVVCDWYVRNNTLLAYGPRRVALLTPSSDGDELQWTPSTGLTHYNLVNEIPPDGDTSYVSDANPGDKDCYHFTSLPYSPASINGVQLSMYARDDDATPRTVAPFFRISATDYPLSGNVLASSYLDFASISETNPATSAPWTTAVVNAMQCGVDLIS